MTDSEKLALIDRMIADFWEYLTDEQQEKCALSLVNSIASVVNFQADNNQ